MLCKKLPVSCINRINGCTVRIIREEMTDHLLKCPSMIASTVEYNQIANDTKGIFIILFIKFILILMNIFNLIDISLMKMPLFL